MADVTTWEERKAAVARAARERRQQWAEAERQRAVEADKRRRAAMEAIVGQVRYVDLLVPDWAWCPVDNDDPEEFAWPDLTACARCYEHNEQGQVMQRAEWNKWHHGVWWLPLQKCETHWDADQDRRVGCDCFCHTLERPPVALA